MEPKYFYIFLYVKKRRKNGGHINLRLSLNIFKNILIIFLKRIFESIKSGIKKSRKNGGLEKLVWKRVVWKEWYGKGGMVYQVKTVIFIKIILPLFVKSY